jgi:hypothetical protein
MEFVRLHLKIQDNRPLKKLSRRDKNLFITNLFKSIGIRKEVVLFSLIGCSVVEFYVASIHTMDVKTKLQAQNAQLLEHFDRASPPSHLKNQSNFRNQVVTRLTILLKRSRFNTLDEAILRDLPQEAIELVREAQNAPPRSDTKMDLFPILARKPPHGGSEHGIS